MLTGMNELELRIARLERQSRFRGLLAVAGVCAALLSAVKGRVEPLVLTSEDGKSELTLQGDRLVFKRDGKPRLALLATDEVSSLMATSVDGKAQVLLSPEALGFRLGGVDTVGLLSRGEGQNRGLAMKDERGRVRAAVLLSTGGLPTVRLEGASEGVITQLTIDEGDVQRLGMTRGKGGLAASVHNGPDWAGVMASNGVGEATLSFAAGGKAHLQLDDGKKQER